MVKICTNGIMQIFAVDAVYFRYTQASSMAPTDPGLLAKLGELYDKEGDKSQAFQCHYDASPARQFLCKDAVHFVMIFRVIAITHPILKSLNG